MLRQWLFRGTSALLLALAVAQPMASAAVAASARPGHECTDHACFCRRAATSSPATPCHAASDEHGPRMTATCNHDTDPALAAAIRPGVLPALPPLPRDDGSRPLSPASSRAPAEGFRTVESPPPQPTRSARG